MRQFSHLESFINAFFLTLCMRKLILASGSPRRKQLLQQLIGKNFEVKESAYDEDNNPNLEPLEIVLHHSLQKGKDVAKFFNSGLVISADTIVLFGDKLLGKPYSEEKAKKILRSISGQWIKVLTGVTVIDIDYEKEIQSYEETRIKMKIMSEKEIYAYVKSGEPLDKAGAFGVQEKGAIFVEKIEGCYFNIVGLPLFLLNTMLEQLGISIFDYNS
ncbi:MAG: Maf family nucleotide pyrophosphatase [Candidatus Hodarchaeota archaeon]